MLSNRSVRGIVAAAGLVVGGGLALGDIETSGYRLEGFNHISYVRSRPIGANGVAEMITDRQYAAILGGAPVGAQGAIDVVMQQCFGGGFLNEIAAGGAAWPARRTFMSAAAFDEVASNIDTVSRPARNGGEAPPARLSNFTRAYVQAQRFSGSAGNRPWFNMARNGVRSNNGTVLVAANEFSAAGPLPERGKEHSQYWSPDQSPNLPGDRPNDYRALEHLRQPTPDQRQYAILVSWSVEDRRHDLNIQRLSSNLTSFLQVPADNIAVLVGNRVNGPALPAIASLDPIDANGLAELAVDGPNSRAAFTDAVQGDYFKVNGVRNTQVARDVQPNRPRAGDKVFIYNTGHGGHATIRNGLDRQGNLVQQFVPTNPANDSGPAGDGVINLNVRRGLANDPMFDNSFIDDSGMVRVQVTTNGPIDPAIYLTLNGVNPLGGDAPLFSSMVMSSSDVLDISPLLQAAGMESPSALYTYQVSVPFELLENSEETGIPIAFGNVFSDDAKNSLLAVTFASGDQEYSHVFVPAPGGGLIVGIAGFAMASRRRRRI